MPLLFANKVSQGFATKVAEIASSLSTTANWLMFVMGFETGWTFSPTAENSYSKAIGLIQFLPATAAWLGTSVEALKAMTAEQQLYWVDKYLQARQKEYGRFSTYHDLYFAVFYPYAINQPDNYIIGSEDGSERVQSIALQNKGFDLNNNNEVTKGEVKKWLDEKVRQNVPESYWSEILKKKVGCSFIAKNFYGGELLAA